MREDKNLTRREMRKKILEERSIEKGYFRYGKTISRHKKEQSERSKSQKLVVRRRKLSTFLAVLAIFVVFFVCFCFNFCIFISVHF